jgi:hypothetical protein
MEITLPKLLFGFQHLEDFDCVLISENQELLDRTFGKIIQELPDFNLHYNELEWKGSKISIKLIKRASDLQKLETLSYGANIIVVGYFPLMQELKKAIRNPILELV